VYLIVRDERPRACIDEYSLWISIDESPDRVLVPIAGMM
jgi:hypothetical protein